LEAIRDDTYRVGDVRDSGATGLAGDPVNSVGASAQEIWSSPRENHCRLINEVDGQVLGRGRRLCKHERRVNIRTPRCVDNALTNNLAKHDATVEERVAGNE